MLAPALTELGPFHMKTSQLLLTPPLCKALRDEKLAMETKLKRLEQRASQFQACDPL